MAIVSFPPVKSANEYGFLAAGGDLEVESLLLAYRSGIFPWPIAEEDLLAWFSPPTRALLFLDEFHVGRSLQKIWDKGDCEFKINSDFPRVIEACSERKKEIGQGDRATTWITPEMIAAYCDFHRAGFAHSIEVYRKDELIGGLYGVSIGRMFAGESMFYRAPNASKLAVIYLVEELKKRNIRWIDCQVMTPLFESFGAREVSRDEFLALLKESVIVPEPVFP